MTDLDEPHLVGAQITAGALVAGRGRGCARPVVATEQDRVPADAAVGGAGECGRAGGALRNRLPDHAGTHIGQVHEMDDGETRRRVGAQPP